MATLPTWLDALLFGYREIAVNGVIVPVTRTIANLIAGAGVTINAVDNPTTKSTDITFTASGGGGGGGGALTIVNVQGNSTVDVQPNTLYEVDTTAGTAGPVTFTTSTLQASAPKGAWFEIVRVDGSASAITTDAPAGGSIQDPNNPGAPLSGVSVALPTKGQSAKWYLNGTTLRLA